MSFEKDPSPEWASKLAAIRFLASWARSADSMNDFRSLSSCSSVAAGILTSSPDPDNSVSSNHTTVSSETTYHGSDGGTPRGIRVKASKISSLTRAARNSSKSLEDIFPDPRRAALGLFSEELGHVSWRREKIPALSAPNEHDRIEMLEEVTE